MLRETMTECGRVRGIPAADPRITAYKGIPFAAPPVGELRWRAPRPAQKWEGVRDCARFAPISMQETPGEDPNAFYSREWHVDPDIPMSEDCLYLNVWTPAKSAEERLPVMVWIFGGGMTCGYPAEMEFDGERLARRGVVLVSVNYRVNSFGLLAHPELTAEARSEGAPPANLALQDQRAAILWVRRNIHAFGGDPECITVFGQSAGGRSTWAQVASPLNRGLFRRAIAQSGGLTGDFARYPALGEAESRGEAFLKHLGVSTIAEARALDAREVLDKTLSWDGPRWSPVLDGVFLPEDPCDAILHGRQNDVELLCGNTANEGSFPMGDTLEEFLPNARRLWKDDFDRMMALAGIRTDEDIQRYYRSRAFHPFEVGNHFAARCWERQGRKPAWLYRFDPEMPGDHAGSFHSSELWFVFETLAKCWRPFEGKHYDLARQMCNYWTNFARTGDPNGPDHNGKPMPYWPPCTAENGESVMLLDDAPHAVCPEADELFAFELSRQERT